MLMAHSNYHSIQVSSIMSELCSALNHLFGLQLVYDFYHVHMRCWLASVMKWPREEKSPPSQVKYFLKRKCLYAFFYMKYSYRLRL